MAGIRVDRRGRPSHDDEPLIQLIASGHTVSQAAKAMGCSQSWAWKLMQKPYFAARVQEYRAFSLQGYAISAREAIPDFLTTIHRIATDAAVSEKVRLNASRTGVELALKLHEAAVVLPRLAVLEALVGELVGESVPLPDAEATKLADLLARLKERGASVTVGAGDEGEDAGDADEPDAAVNEG